MNRGIVLLGLVLSAMFALAFAQKIAEGEESHRVCGQQLYEDYLKNKHPHMNWDHEHFENIMAKLLKIKQFNGIVPMSLPCHPFQSPLC